MSDTPHTFLAPLTNYQGMTGIFSHLSTATLRAAKAKDKGMTTLSFCHNRITFFLPIHYVELIRGPIFWLIDFSLPHCRKKETHRMGRTFILSLCCWIKFGATFRSFLRDPSVFLCSYRSHVLFNYKFSAHVISLFVHVYRFPIN